MLQCNAEAVPIIPENRGDCCFRIGKLRQRLLTYPARDRYGTGRSIDHSIRNRFRRWPAACGAGRDAVRAVAPVQTVPGGDLPRLLSPCVQGGGGKTSRFKASGHKGLRRRRVATVSKSEFMDTIRSQPATDLFRRGEFSPSKKIKSGGIRRRDTQIETLSAKRPFADRQNRALSRSARAPNSCRACSASGSPRSPNGFRCIPWDVSVDRIAGDLPASISAVTGRC